MSFKETVVDNYQQSPDHDRMQSVVRVAVDIGTHFCVPRRELHLSCRCGATMIDQSIRAVLLSSQTPVSRILQHECPRVVITMLMRQPFLYDYAGQLRGRQNDRVPDVVIDRAVPEDLQLEVGPTQTAGSWRFRFHFATTSPGCSSFSIHHQELSSEQWQPRRF